MKSVSPSQSFFFFCNLQSFAKEEHPLFGKTLLQGRILPSERTLSSLSMWPLIKKYLEQPPICWHLYLPSEMHRFAWFFGGGICDCFGHTNIILYVFLCGKWTWRISPAVWCSCLVSMCLHWKKSMNILGFWDSQLEHRCIIQQCQGWRQSLQKIQREPAGIPCHPWNPIHKDELHTAGRTILRFNQALSIHI